MDIDDLIKILHENNLSCVIKSSNGELIYCRNRGVIDLYNLLKISPDVLKNATVVDKVVGKGAAALIVLGGVKRLYSDVVSRPAIEMLRHGNVEVSYDKLVENIINRTGNDICPLEKLTLQASTASEALPLIEKFILEMQRKK